VDLGSDGGPQAWLTISYENLSRRPVGACVQESRYGETYADMMERCYWDYVRIYVPAGSELLDGPDLPWPSGSLLARNSAEMPPEPLPAVISQGDMTAFTSFFALEPGGQRSLTFHYRLPAGVLEEGPDGTTTYYLRVLKQPGTEAVPLNVEVLLPPDAQVIYTHPGDLPLVTTDLRTDREFRISFRRSSGMEGRDPRMEEER
jgi:hypothetical protein